MIIPLSCHDVLGADESRISHLTLGCGSSVPIMAALLNGARFSISTSSAMVWSDNFYHRKLFCCCVKPSDLMSVIVAIRQGELAGGAFRGRRPVIVAGDGEVSARIKESSIPCSLYNPRAYENNSAYWTLLERSDGQ